MRLELLRQGDEVLNITSWFIAIERASGEVDIIPIMEDDIGMYIDMENILTIGYNSGAAQKKEKDSKASDIWERRRFM